MIGPKPYEKIWINFQNYRIEFKVFMPKVKVDGLYESSGMILEIPTRGKGKFLMDFSGFNFL